MNAARLRRDEIELMELSSLRPWSSGSRVLSRDQERLSSGRRTKSKSCTRASEGDDDDGATGVGRSTHERDGMMAMVMGWGVVV